MAWRRLARFEPVDFDPTIVDLVERWPPPTAASVRRMPSGAGHDAQMLARVCPAGMIFTPSVGGISHNPAELTAPDDLEAGANVLLEVVLRLATTPDATLRGTTGSGAEPADRRATRSTDGGGS